MKLESVKAIVEALGESHVRYLVVGGLAVVAHGYVRYTKDVDLVIQLVPDNVRRAMASLGRLGYRPAVPVPIEAFSEPENRERWIRDRIYELHRALHAARRGGSRAVTSGSGCASCAWRRGPSSLSHSARLRTSRLSPRPTCEPRWQGI